MLHSSSLDSRHSDFHAQTLKRGMPLKTMLVTRTPNAVGGVRFPTTKT